ncbi:MAG: 2-hydroxychromene-2-carboxylate isomerase [Neomegalonema sp.]
MVKIEYFFSVLSPFTYLAGTRLEEVAARRDAAINYRPMDIMKVFGETGGVPVPQRHPSRQAYRLQELKRIARMNRMTLNIAPAHWPTDQRPASAALIAAQAAGKSICLAAHAMIRACWAEHRDVADPTVITDVLAMNGSDYGALGDHLPAAEEQFDRNTAEAIERGVFGAPFYIVGEEMFWGQDRLPYLDAHLAETNG